MALRLGGGAARAHGDGVGAVRGAQFCAILCAIHRPSTRPLRYLYRFSRAFRVVQHESGFIAMARDDSGASEAEKVAVMKTLYHESAPSPPSSPTRVRRTASSSARSSSPRASSRSAPTSAPSLPQRAANGPALFHALRVVALGAGTIGIASAPIARQWYQLERRVMTSGVATEADKEYTIRVAGQNTLHVLMAAPSLLGVPILEIAALAIDFSSFGTHLQTHEIDGCALLWLAVALTRVALGVVALASFFGFGLGHEEAGKAHTADESYKAYAAEAQACVGFARIMLLLAVQSWFDWDSDDGFATWGWASQLGVGAVALYHLVYALGFCLSSTIALCRRMEVSDADYLKAYAIWKVDELAAEAKAKMVLDGLASYAKERAVRGAAAAPACADPRLSSPPMRASRTGGGAARVGRANSDLLDCPTARRARRLASPKSWSCGSALLKGGSTSGLPLRLSSFSKRAINVKGDHLTWATTGAPDTPRDSGTAVAFRRRETASHPHGLSITLDSGATTELCVDSEPEVVALAARC